MIEYEIQFNNFDTYSIVMNGYLYLKDFQSRREAKRYIQKLREEDFRND